MFDLSWTEILVIAVAAIIFIGPKELPTFLRLLGRWTAKARAMAREFQGHVDDMVRESELEEVRKQVETASSDIGRTIESTVDPKGEVSQALNAPELSGRPTDPTPTSTPTATVDSGSLETPPPAEPASVSESAPAAPEQPATPDSAPTPRNTAA